MKNAKKHEVAEQQLRSLLTLLRVPQALWSDLCARLPGGERVHALAMPSRMALESLGFATFWRYVSGAHSSLGSHHVKKQPRPSPLAPMPDWNPNPARSDF